jgi:hypothetical protein
MATVYHSTNSHDLHLVRDITSVWYTKHSDDIILKLLHDERILQDKLAEKIYIPVSENERIQVSYHRMYLSNILCDLRIRLRNAKLEISMKKLEISKIAW